MQSIGSRNHRRLACREIVSDGRRDRSAVGIELNAPGRNRECLGADTVGEFVAARAGTLLAVAGDIHDVRVLWIDGNCEIAQRLLARIDAATFGRIRQGKGGPGLSAIFREIERNDLTLRIILGVERDLHETDRERAAGSGRDPADQLVAIGCDALPGIRVSLVKMGTQLAPLSRLRKIPTSSGFLVGDVVAAYIVEVVDGSPTSGVTGTWAGSNCTGLKFTPRSPLR